MVRVAGLIVIEMSCGNTPLVIRRCGVLRR